MQSNLILNQLQIDKQKSDKIQYNNYQQKRQYSQINLYQSKSKEIQVKDQNLSKNDSCEKNTQKVEDNSQTFCFTSNICQSQQQPQKVQQIHINQANDKPLYQISQSDGIKQLNESNNICNQKMKKIQQIDLDKQQQNQSNKMAIQVYEDDNKSDIQIDAYKQNIKLFEQPYRQRIIQHNNQIIDKDIIPGNIQIQKIARLLKQQFYNYNLQKIITSLHQIFHQNCQIQNNDLQHYQNKFSQDYSKINLIVRHRQSNHLPMDMRYTQQKRIAISFLKFGYGIRILRQHINDPNITAIRYNNTITNITKMAYKKLQQFVKNYGKIITPINPIQQKIIRAPLINCDKWMPPQQLQTYYKFIKLIHNIQSVSINQTQTLKLHQCCLKQLKQRFTSDGSHRKIRRRRARNLTNKMYHTQTLYNKPPGMFNQQSNRQGFTANSNTFSMPYGGYTSYQPIPNIRPLHPNFHFKPYSAFANTQAIKKF